MLDHRTDATRPLLLSLLPWSPTCPAAEGGLQVVELWREELLDATLEMDGSLKARLFNCYLPECAAVES